MAFTSDPNLDTQSRVTKNRGNQRIRVIPASYSLRRYFIYRCLNKQSVSEMIKSVDFYNA